MSGFGFGQPAGTGFGGFGGNKPATTTTAFGFGTTPIATQVGTTFGATTFGNAPSAGLGGQVSFGAAPSTAAPSLTFGTPASTTALAAPASLGALAAPTALVAPAAPIALAAPAAPTGLAAPTALAAQAAPQLGFGAPPASAAPSGLFGSSTGSTLNFGAPPATQPSLFGTLPVASMAPVSMAPASMAPASMAPASMAPASMAPTLPPALLFGAASSQAPPTAGLFAAATATQPALPTLNFGAVVATTKPATGLFGLSTPATTTTAGGFTGLGTSTATATPTLTLGGLGTAASAATSLPASQGFSLSSTTTSFNLGGTTTPSLGLLSSTASTLPTVTSAAAPTTTSIGLGGVDNSAASGGLAGTGSSGRQETKTIKENQIPNEVAQLVESFRTYVKQQKSLSCEVARCSERPLQKVKEDTEALRQLLATTSAGLQRCRTIADKLKSDTAKGLQHTEMAQRTHDTPPGLQYDNTAPLAYFAELVSNFEREIQLFRQEIETAEKHVKSQTQSTALSPAELTQALRRLHDSFIALAGRLQTVHTAVEAQKEQYLSLRKYTLNDTTDVFQEAAKALTGASSIAGGRSNAACRNTAGPTPFSSLGGQHGLGLLGIGAMTSSFSSANPLGK